MGKKEAIEEIDKQIKKLNVQGIISIIWIIFGIGLCFTVFLLIPGIILFLLGAYGLNKGSNKIADLKLRKAGLK